MSSLAAAQSDNFYHPPEWDPSKQSRKKFGNHKGHNQYEQRGVIRFEMPFDGWCEECGRHIAKGSRFNAKKEHDGMYFSTKIWKFTMTCHSCPATLIVVTDPKNTTYGYKGKLTRKEEEFDDGGMAADGLDSRVQSHLDSIYKLGGHAAEEEREVKRTNAMVKLEHAGDDRRVAATEGARVTAILTRNAATGGNYDYDANASLRRNLSRTRRREAQANEREQSTARFGNLPDWFTLAPATAADDADAKRMAFEAGVKRRRKSSGRAAAAKVMMATKVDSSVRTEVSARTVDEGPKFSKRKKDKRTGAAAREQVGSDTSVEAQVAEEPKREARESSRVTCARPVPEQAANGHGGGALAALSAMYADSDASGDGDEDAESAIARVD